MLADARPRRTAASSRPAPATAALRQTLNPPAAGIDSGATECGGCVPPGAISSLPPAGPRVPAVLPPTVRGFGSCTADWSAIAAWWRQCQGTTVAMEAPGVDWLPLYALLASASFQGLLVAPRQGPRAPHRPTPAVHACPWRPRRPRRGRLPAAFRPAEPLRVWRSSPRQRATCSEDAGRHLQRIEQALEHMHGQLPAVGSDITGVSGMRLLRAIVGGERAPTAWARRRAHRGTESAAPRAPALPGTWQPEPLCAVQPSLAWDDDSHPQSRACARGSAAHRQGRAWPEGPPLAPKRRGRRRKDQEGTCDARQRLHHGAGGDWTASEGIEESTALVVWSAIGTARRRWPREKHCGSGLGLAPNPRQAGGKVQARATRPGVNRAAPAWRWAAPHVPRSHSALGAFCRRIAARRGLAKAITATASKLARLVYARLKHGTADVAQGLEAYETAYRERGVRQGKRQAAALGLLVVEREAVAQPS